LREPELTALAPLPGGGALLAAAPSGMLYRLGADDRLTTLTKLPATFVWRLLPEGDGNLLAITGHEGKVFRLHLGEGSALDVQQIAQLKSKNLLSAWRDARGEYGERGAIYIGGQDPGWLYRIAPGPNARAEVLYNPGAEEIRGIQPVEEGLALALNNERAPTAQALQLTLRMGNAMGGLQGGLQMPTGRAPMPTPPGTTPEEAAKAMASAFAPGQQRPQMPGGSRIVILRRNGFARDVWGAPESPIHDLTAGKHGALLVAAGGQGRVFEVKPTGEFAIVADVRDDYVLRLTGGEKSVLLACARNGAVYDMALRPAREAVFLSRALDAGAPVRWGKFYVHGAASPLEAATEHELKGVTIAFRTGNDGDVESDMWSNWSPAQPVRHAAALQLPPNVARYLQYRVTLQAGADAAHAPRIDNAEAFFTEPNGAPVVLEIRIAPQGAAPAGAKMPTPQQVQQIQQAQQGKPSTPGQGMPQPAGDGLQSVAREPHSNAMVLNIAWRAADPNNDTMRYALYFKGRDEGTWKLIDDKLSAPQMALNVGGVADGYYRFRIVASDELDNPQGEGLSDEKISDEFTIDNTPPEIFRLMASAHGDKATISCTITDALSIVSDLKVDIDNKDSYPVFPADGIFDERTERFEWSTPALPPGEHTITLNATDRTGNTVTGKVVVMTRGEGTAASAPLPERGR
jgi:hypothetical protein